MSITAGSPAYHRQHINRLCQFQAIFDQKITDLRHTLSARIDELVEQHSEDFRRLQQKLILEPINSTQESTSTNDDIDDEFLYDDADYFAYDQLADEENTASITANSSIDSAKTCQNVQPPTDTTIEQLNDDDVTDPTAADDEDSLSSRHSISSEPVSVSDINQYFGDDNFAAEKPLQLPKEQSSRPKAKTVYQCEICAYTSGNRRSFQLHQVSVHGLQTTGLQQLHCDRCTKFFYVPAALRSHMRTHTGERPFVCQLCGHCSKDRSLFNRHMRVHRGQRDHKCGLCERTFLCRPTLAVHMQSHTGERPHECPVCQRGYSKRYHVRKHLKKFHGVEDVDAVFPPKRSWPRSAQPKLADDAEKETTTALMVLSSII